MAPAKKGQEEGHSAINEVVMWSTPSAFTSTSMEWVPRVLRDLEASMKKMGTPDACINTRLNKAVWVKGRRNIPYCIHLRLSRKHEDEDLPNKLYTLVIYAPATMLKIYSQCRREVKL
ncbi:large ribosomal subunit protein eL31-like [Ochotona princeps]|uniref:large ribosomal subunit protein eL31-like n=1 Tax=Ochotona princeps TaxID=9978 RepID=UPI002714A34B|nr:large ribosomal subunit protein eL31-like [Ochotona princeps]